MGACTIRSAVRIDSLWPHDIQRNRKGDQLPHDLIGYKKLVTARIANEPRSVAGSK